MKSLKVQIFVGPRRTLKSVYRGETLAECVEKMFEEYKTKGLIK